MINTFLNYFIALLISKPKGTQYSLTRKQKALAAWYCYFFIICLINSVLIFVFRLYDDDFYLAFFLPFAHLGIAVVGYIIWGLTNTVKTLSYSYGLLSDENKYIIEKYPTIWLKLHPLGEFSRNDFAFIAFLRGKYDDGSDDKLNEIKYMGQVRFSLVLLPFFIVLSVWLINIFLIFGLKDVLK